ncbi:MAG: ribonuclease H-like domain-containing protein [Candidatus Woesearchaeota archaeon]
MSNTTEEKSGTESKTKLVEKMKRGGKKKSEDETKKQAQAHLESQGYTTKDFPYSAMRSDYKLFESIECHAVNKFGKRSPNKLYESWGWHSKRNNTSEEWFVILRDEILTKDISKKVFEGRIKHQKTSIKQFFFDLGKKGKSVYQIYHQPAMKDYDAVRFKNDINRCHPDLQKEYGLTLYDAITHAPPNQSELTTRITELYYQGAHVESQHGLSLVQPDGRRLLWAIGSGNSEKYHKTSHNHHKHPQFLKRIYPYINTPLKKSDFETNSTLVNYVATAAEHELLLMLRILEKFDPNLETIDSSIREFFPPPLKKIYPHTLDEISITKQGQSRTIPHTDIRINTNGLELIVETKSGIIRKRTIEEDIIKKYEHTTLNNGERIDSKIVFLNSTKILYPEATSALESQGFKVISESLFRTWYAESLNLLAAKDPEFFTRTIPHSPQLLLQIHDVIANTPHVLSRRMHDHYCTWVRNLLKMDAKMIAQQSPETKPPGKYIKSTIEPLSAITNFYNPEHLDILHHIDFKNKAYIDEETLGFNYGGNIIGIFGVATNINTVPSLAIYVSNNPSEEKQNLEEIAPLIKGKEIITFNGLRFDVPLAERRYAAHLLSSPFTGQIIDHRDQFAKYAKEHNYPGGGQIQFERADLGISRKGDVPGKYIPKVLLDHMYGKQETRIKDKATGKVKIYHMKDAIYHNKFDVLTLVLMDKLLNGLKE